jgi:hypothetical protein
MEKWRQSSVSPLSPFFLTSYSNFHFWNLCLHRIILAESTAAAGVFHMSVFNAFYLLAIAVAMAGWAWLIFDCVSSTIGG